MGRAIGGSAEKARRVADAQGVDDRDGHALAGFVEAEASFGIRPNNGGRSWVCHMTLTQRDDDADMLVDIARVTGLGRLSRRPAQRKSRPQVCWAVQSKLECRRLVDLLKRYPLRGRKGREFAVWASAVVEWTESRYGASGATTHRALRAHAEQLRELRRYVDRSDERTASSAGADGLTAFFGGFFTGEGSFSLDGRAVACIHVRADDADLLRTFHERFDLGRMSLATPVGLNPSVKWTVGRRAELPRAIALFDAAVLRGRKRREFDAWRIGAAEYARGRDRDNTVVAAARAALQEARSYVEREIVLPTVSGQDAYVAVLRTLATEEPVGKLTATAYERARERHPEWPTRNTIAALFGGWACALEAAGLGSRVTDRARSRARRA
jgi:LAGLIDADG endonuclease